MKKLITIAGFIIAILAMPILSQAISIDVDNPGFEADVLGDGEWTTSITGWTVEGTSGIYSAPNWLLANDSSNAAFANVGASIYQQLAYTLRPAELTLSVDVGWRNDISQTPYAIQLWAGGNLLASSSEPSLIQGEFVTSMVSYLVTDASPFLGEQVTIRLANLDGIQVNFDNVSLSNDEHAPVPEPATLLLLGSGLAGFAGMRKKFKK